MSQPLENKTSKSTAIRTEKVFERFHLNQRVEHWVLFISFTVLLLTGLPQKYRSTSWSMQLLSTPERVNTIQTIHHIAAIAMILLVIYHLGQAIYLMTRRKLPGDMLITWQDCLDAGRMVGYLLFLRKEKPKYGKYSFEEKVTYWFIFFGIGILVVSGLILWFPEVISRLLPGSVIPAAKLAHSTEAIVAGVFLLIWHVYHVHLERLNLSIFTGKMNEKDMETYHTLEYRRLTGEEPTPGGEKKT